MGEQAGPAGAANGAGGWEWGATSRRGGSRPDRARNPKTKKITQRKPAGSGGGKERVAKTNVATGNPKPHAAKLTQPHHDHSTNIHICT
jgi:hypothetical protein